MHCIINYLEVLKGPKEHLDTTQNLSHSHNYSVNTFESTSEQVRFDRTGSQSFSHFRVIFEQFPSRSILKPFLNPKRAVELTRPCRPDILK